MERRALKADLYSTYGSKLLDVMQIATYAGCSRSTAEREICNQCKVFTVGKRRKYHVTDVAAALDRR